MSQVYKVPPRSWKAIDTIASKTRKILFNDQEFASPGAMHSLFESGKLARIQIDDYGVGELAQGEEACFIPKENSLIISEATYYDLVNKVPRASFTLAHEIGHKVLHGSYFTEAIREKRSIPVLQRQQIPAYQNAECQANQFASAFLIPIEMIISDIKKGLSESEIADKYHVSFDVAYFRTQYVKNKYAIIPDETPRIAAEKTVRR